VTPSRADLEIKLGEAYRTAGIDVARHELPAGVLDRTRASLAEIYAAARHAELLVGRLLGSPQAQAAIERRRLSASARSSRPASSAETAAASARAAALELLALPRERWPAVVASLGRRQQKIALKCIAAAADACARTAPDRAHQLADFLLQAVRRHRLPAQAPLLRRQLAGRALLARARALIALRSYASALPVIADAHAAFPRTAAYRRYRIDAQLLRAEVLAAAGHDAEALETLTVSARLAIDGIEPRRLVDALTSVAVILCAHKKYEIARPALALASHVAQQPGNESSLTTLHNGVAECAFLGYSDDGGRRSEKVTY
jgi:tetratricopeptide (TPR) repeat protein